MMGFMDKFDWLMPAGFYYRMMHKPASIWPIAMKQIRKAAGLGTIASDFEMKGVYDEIYPRADVCIVGGGAAGMTAALAAATLSCARPSSPWRPRKAGGASFFMKDAPGWADALITGLPNTARENPCIKESGNYLLRWNRRPTSACSSAHP